MELISARYLIPITADPIPNGAIAIDNNEIIEIGTMEELQKHYPHAHRETYLKHIIMPGLVNAHVQLEMGGLRNYPFDPVRTIVSDVNYVDWLITTLDYRRNAKQEKIKEAVEEGIMLALESGTTCLADVGSFEGVIPPLRSIGMRAVVFQEIMHSDRGNVQDRYESALAMVEHWMEEADPLIRVGLAPAAPYLVSRNILKIMALYCRGQHIPLMTHVAESFAEMEFFYNSSGDMAEKLFPLIGWKEELPPAFMKTPVAYLDEIDFLRARPILAGCVQLTPEDRDRIAASGSGMVILPRMNHFLKLGEVRFEPLLKRDIPIALGTNGLHSNASLSMWDEMRYVYETNITGKKTASLTCYDLLKMATLGGARVLGMEPQIGSLEAGKKADYLVVKVEDGDFSDPTALYEHLVKNTKSYHVHKVVVDGRLLKSL